MVKEWARKRQVEISIEGRDLINRKDSLKYIKSNFGGLSLSNIESLKEIIFQIKKDILEIAEDNLCLKSEVKM